MIPKPVRSLVWDRAGDCCERCGKGLTRESDHSLHHRVFRSRGGQDTVDNLVLLCGSGTTGCHEQVHKHARGGFNLPSGTNPQMVPIKHWSDRELFLLPDGNYGEEVWAA
jgi:5-methylcytosine-specific restriction endonuclease McrA